MKQEQFKWNRLQMEDGLVVPSFIGVTWLWFMENVPNIPQIMTLFSFPSLRKYLWIKGCEETAIMYEIAPSWATTWNELNPLWKPTDQKTITRIRLYFIALNVDEKMTLRAEGGESTFVEIVLTPNWDNRNYLQHRTSPALPLLNSKSFF